MSLSSSLVSLGDGTLPESFEGLKSQIPLEWIEAALTERCMATVPKRKLPMETVIWLVIGMALYRDRPIGELVRRLDLVLPDKDGNPQDVTEGAIPQARDRVGSRPVGELFRATARRWAADSAESLLWRGLKVLGVDGTTLSIPDTTENRATFGGPTTGNVTAGYPMVRLSALMVLRSHVVWDFAFGRYENGEAELLGRLMSEIPEESVTILDRGYNSHAVVQGFDGKKRHCLVRWKGVPSWKVVKPLGPGDAVVEIELKGCTTLKKHPELRPVYQMRMIRYERPGFRKSVLLTTMLDPKKYPKAEIADLYHERWELELGYDEIKAQELARMETIRSKTVERVKQEIYGLMIAYNLVRREMENAARALKLPPRRLSFQYSLRVIRDLFWWASTASPGSLPKMVERMRMELKHIVLPERRGERSYPRQRKRRSMKYAHKPGHLIPPSTEKRLI